MSENGLKALIGVVAVLFAVWRAFGNVRVWWRGPWG